MQARPRSHSRRWISFFVVLASLSAVALIVPLIYNLSIQLRPEQVSEARRLWEEQRISNYDLEYLIREHRSGRDEERAFLVQVRNGRVVVVVDSGGMVYLDPSLAGFAGIGVFALSSVNPDEYGVLALFHQIEQVLSQDEQTGRRNFATAQFDPRDGHPYHYVHRDRGAQERIEWTIKMTRLFEESPPR